MPSRAQGRADAATLLSGADLNNDSVVTRDEFLTARTRLFQNAGANASGGLNQAEFTTVLGERAKRFANRAYNEVDANGDGIVSQGEWDSAPPRAFDRLDSNNDSFLSSDEMEKAQR